MGIAGVAWATFLCQSISCILSIIIVLKRLHSLKCNEDERVRIFDIHIFGRIAAIAVPSILQQSFISIGNIIIQSVINGFGTSVMAGYSAAIKLNNLVITSLTTLGNGISNYTAQNLGAGKKKESAPVSSQAENLYGSYVFLLLYYIGSPAVTCFFFYGAEQYVGH